MTKLTVLSESFPVVANDAINSIIPQFQSGKLGVKRRQKFIRITDRQQQEKYMRVLMMTDMEGIAGMVNFVDYCRPESSPGVYYSGQR